MAYPFTEDHDMIREAARGFLQAWYDGGKGIEKFTNSGEEVDRGAWHSFAVEQGMAGIAVDENYGGAGLGDLGRVVVMEELGASLCPIPFLSTCGIVADLLAAFGTDEAKAEYLSKIASGDISAAYSDGYDAKEKKVFSALNAACVDVIFLSRRTGNAIEIIAIPSGTNGLNITPEKTMDPTRSFSRMDWSGVAENDIAVIGETNEAELNTVVTQSFIALAAECVGGAQACLDMTLEYTGQRVQFDRTIASFQAIKHRCADMFVLIEAARSAVYYAATAPEDEKTEAALIAKAYASDAFFKVAGDAIQMHGGIGFTWEYPLHFFFKRARANRAMFGSSASAYNQLADHVFGDAA